MEKQLLPKWFTALGNAPADTDGDGFSDYVEIAGRAVGKTWYDPIVPASYIYDDPDCDTNGVPDRWEGTGYVYCRL